MNEDNVFTRALRDGETGPAVVMLAPMVRAGHLPLRLLALQHGAPVVFSEELIAKKLQKCVRVENTQNGTIDFILPASVASSSSPEPSSSEFPFSDDPTSTSSSSSQPQHAHREVLVYQTCILERDRNVLQIGAAGPEEALEATRLVMNDVAGVDLNCGCPQHFSVSGGMGAALLKAPQNAEIIVKTLRANLPARVAVSCKIRMMPDEEDTVAMLKRLEAAGADAVTIHLRRVNERPREAARWGEAASILTRAALRIPVVLNGDIWTYEDAVRLLGTLPSPLTHPVLTMSARGALADFAAPFSSKTATGETSATIGRGVREVCNEYLAVSSSVCGSSFSQDKWFVQQVMRYTRGRPLGKLSNASVASARTLEELLQALGLRPRKSKEECWGPDGGERGEKEWKHAMRACRVELDVVSFDVASSTATTTTTTTTRIQAGEEDEDGDRSGIGEPTPAFCVRRLSKRRSSKIPLLGGGRRRLSSSVSKEGDGMDDATKKEDEGDDDDDDTSGQACREVGGDQTGESPLTKKQRRAVSAVVG